MKLSEKQILIEENDKKKINYNNQHHANSSKSVHQKNCSRVTIDAKLLNLKFKNLYSLIMLIDRSKLRFLHDILFQVDIVHVMFYFSINSSKLSVF